LVRGEFSGDVQLDINIVLPDGKVAKSSPISELNAMTAQYGTAVYGTSKYGGLISRFGEDSFDIPAKTHMPIVELDDGGRGTFLKVDTVNLITKSLPLE
jgi:hypothetical protein